MSLALWAGPRQSCALSSAGQRTFRRTDKLRHPHLYPEPRLAAGRKLLRLATAAIDLSDGLSTDLAHLCEESGLAAEIDAEALPVDARATLEQALHGGEDYELLFTASPKTSQCPVNWEECWCTPLAG